MTLNEDQRVNLFAIRIFQRLKNSGKTLIVLVGPTAVGKTGLAIQIAKVLHTEIVSADSRQIFRELTIGTAKPSDAELAAVPHHFVNSHTILEDYDAAQFGRDALQIITERFAFHDALLLCGGSGLYIKAVCEGFDEIPETPAIIREELMQQYEHHGIGWLQERMLALDPDHFQELDQKNPHRLIRALEVKLATGASIASFRTKRKISHPFSIVKIGLELSRQDLYARIDARMDQMIDDGLFEEARSLFQYRDRRALQTVGYQEIFEFMEGKYDRAEAIRLLKRNSRHYAKRQLTWFKKDPEINWFLPEDVDKIMDFVKHHVLIDG